MSGAGTHAGVPISFADNVALEELSLVVAAENPLFLRESVRNSLVLGAVVWTIMPHNFSTRLSNRLLKISGGYNTRPCSFDRTSDIQSAKLMLPFNFI